MQSLSLFAGSGIGFGLGKIKYHHPKNKIQIQGWKTRNFMNTNTKQSLAVNVMTGRKGIPDEELADKVMTGREGIPYEELADKIRTGREGIPHEELVDKFRTVMDMYHKGPLGPSEKKFLMAFWDNIHKIVDKDSIHVFHALMNPYYLDPSTEVLPGIRLGDEKCTICGKFGHCDWTCPYFWYYPEGAHIEPGAPIKLVELHGCREVDYGPRRAIQIHQMPSEKETEVVNQCDVE